MVGELRTIPSLNRTLLVSVSLPRLGGWRVLNIIGFRLTVIGFSLVAEIGWLASLETSCHLGPLIHVSVSLPRLGGWRDKFIGHCYVNHCTFQSRCRDWVVGERTHRRSPWQRISSFSLVAEIGWLASINSKLLI